MTRKDDLPDPKLDLQFERLVDIPPELVWAAWTRPEHIKHWFTPAPWKTIECEIDLRPGGIFSTMMQSPEGANFPNIGCYLELVENRRLVFTNAMAPGFRPASPEIAGGENNTETGGAFAFTAVVSMEPQAAGCRYTATVLHQSERGCRQHAAMGFETGWSKALEQLVAYMQAR
jgi:uncharacterized protein YndB with AHSA1/START domain